MNHESVTNIFFSLMNTEELIQDFISLVENIHTHKKKAQIYMCVSFKILYLRVYAYLEFYFSKINEIDFWNQSVLFYIVYSMLYDLSFNSLICSKPEISHQYASVARYTVFFFQNCALSCKKKLEKKILAFFFKKILENYSLSVYKSSNLRS